MHLDCFIVLIYCANLNIPCDCVQSPCTGWFTSPKCCRNVLSVRLNISRLYSRVQDEIVNFVLVDMHFQLVASRHGVGVARSLKKLTSYVDFPYLDRFTAFFVHVCQCELQLNGHGKAASRLEITVGLDTQDASNAQAKTS